MLGKLLVYELRKYSKLFALFTLVSIVISALFGLFHQYNDVVVGVISTIFVLLQFALPFCVVCFVYESLSSLYTGKDLYQLMIPARPGELLAAKLISSLIWTAWVIVIYVLVITVFTFFGIVLQGPDVVVLGNMQYIGSRITEILPWIGSTLLFILMTSLLNAAIMFASISLAYQVPKYSTGISIVLITLVWIFSGYIIDFVTYLSSSGPALIFAVDSQAFNLFDTFMQSLALWGVMAVLICVFMGISWVLLSRRFNVR